MWCVAWRWNANTSVLHCVTWLQELLNAIYSFSDNNTYLLFNRCGCVWVCHLAEPL